MLFAPALKGRAIHERQGIKDFIVGKLFLEGQESSKKFINAPPLYTQIILIH